MKIVKLIGGVVIVIVLLGIFFGSGQKAQDAYVQQQMTNIENQVAEDAVKQYEIAKRQGDKIQIYTQASLVAAAYLQAKDEPNYIKWKEIEKKAAADAGMPE